MSSVIRQCSVNTEAVPTAGVHMKAPAHVAIMPVTNHASNDEPLHVSSVQVLFAGSEEQVRQVLKAATSFREDLVDRGVLLVALPIFGDAANGAGTPAPLSEEDLRYADPNWCTMLLWCHVLPDWHWDCDMRRPSNLSARCRACCPLRSSFRLRRFRANPLRIGDWASWFNQQLSASSKSSEQVKPTHRFPFCLYSSTLQWLP